MKTRTIMMSVSLAVVSPWVALGGEEQNDRSVFTMADDFSDENLFEGAQSFEEPDIADIVLERGERRPEISIKDVPFYLKLFCSYVYEEKLERWYYAFFGYFARWKQKRIDFERHTWGT